MFSLSAASINRIFGAGLIAAVLIGPALSLRKSPAGVVGSTRISQREVEYRDHVVQVYFPGEKRKLGFFQLYKSAINLEILRSNGVEFSREQILAEENRISKNSRDTERLSAIRNIFGDDFESYLKVFVLPNLADRYIYSEFFVNSPHVQTESLARAREIIRQLHATGGDGIAELAKNGGYKFDLLSLSLKEGLRWHTQKVWDFENQKYAPVKRAIERPKLEIGAEASQWYAKVLNTLSAGQVYPEPISYGEFWLVVRSGVKHNGESSKLEVIFVPKLNYQIWYEQEKSKLTIQTFEAQVNPEELEP